MKSEHFPAAVVFGTVTFIVASAVFLVMGCTSEPPIPRITFDRYCSMEQSERVAQFIVACAEAANPKSDEEDEDLVAQCEKTAKNVMCPEVAFVKVYSRDDYRSPVPCSQVKDPSLMKACEVYTK
jgi:hypothetical protein